MNNSSDSERYERLKWKVQGVKVDDSNFESVRPKGSKLTVQEVKVDGPGGERGNLIDLGIDLLTFLPSTINP